jgi:hypothetical protein
MLNAALTRLYARFGNVTTMEWWNYLYLNEGMPILYTLQQINEIVVGFATLVS